MLVPGQSQTLIGIEVLVVGLIVWITAITLDVTILQKKEPQYRTSYMLNMALNQIALLPYILAGIFVLTRGAGGRYSVSSRNRDFFYQGHSGCMGFAGQINR